MGIFKRKSRAKPIIDEDDLTFLNAIKDNPKTLGDITKAMKSTIKTRVFHTNKLLNLGLIELEREGTTKYASITQKGKTLLNIIAP